MDELTVILIVVPKNAENALKFKGVPTLTAEAIYSGIYPFEEDDGKGRYILIRHKDGIERVYQAWVEFVAYIEGAGESSAVTQ